MTQFSDAQNWIDLVDHIIIGIILITVAAVPALISAKNHKGIKKIQHQVVNGHSSPLRSDLDKVIEKLSETADKVDSISRDLGEMRQELSREEGRREISDKELRDDFDRKFMDLFQRFIK